MTEQNISILEKIIKGVPNAPHPSPFPIEETPYFDGPWFNIGRRAVEILEDPIEIGDFVKQYKLYIQENFGVDKDTAERSAKDVVGYCTGYVDDVKANYWFRALPDISHPIMGRKRPFIKDAIDTYLIMGKTDDPEIKKYLGKIISEELGSVGINPTFDIKYTEGQDNPSYFAFQLKLTHNGICQNSADVYLFLTGFARGLPTRMQSDIGKSSNLSIETLSGNK